MSYGFWFYRLERRIIFWKPSLNRTITKCTIDTSVIKFAGSDNNDPLIIHIASIKECKLNLFDSSPIYKIVTIKLFEDRPILILFAHPLKPNQPQFTNTNESKAFVSVVNGIIKGKDIGINPNPYLRAFEDMGKQPEPECEVWDHYVNPWVYHKRYNKTYTPKEVIINAFKLIIFILLFGLVYGLIIDVLLN